MVVNVSVISEKKGSNPGGMCMISGNGDLFPAYFKYVYASKVAGASSFNSHNQPVYEALTFQLVRNFGLDTPDFFIVKNQKRDVHFEGWKPYLSHDPSGRDFYFATRLVGRGELEDESTLSRQIESERLYLDSLLVSDVVNKRQNIKFCLSNGVPTIFYIDLGCSFVHAVGGFLVQPSSLKPRITDEKQLRQVTRKLETKAIISSDGRTTNLAQLVKSVPDIELPTLNPRGSSPLRSLISRVEIDEIQRYLSSGLVESIPKFREAGVLVNL